MRISVVSPNPLLVDGILSIVGSLPGFTPIPSDGTFPAAAARADAGVTDVLILAGVELGAKERQAIENWRLERRLRVLTVVNTEAEAQAADETSDRVMYSAQGGNGLRKALNALASARVPVSLMRETRSPYGSGRRLTPRELEVATLIGQGMSNRQISQILGIQEQSVKNLASTIMRKLDCKNRVQVALRLSTQNTAA
ncbi:MAG: LuxR C-terminal-related transcriptional regulator, partial [Fimbriimonadaceae bacterium]